MRTCEVVGSSSEDVFDSYTHQNEKLCFER